MLTLFQLQYCPALYINIENLPNLWQKTLQNLPNWRHSKNINKIIFKHYKLNNNMIKIEKNENIALFPQYEFNQILDLLGIMLHIKSLSHCINSKQIGFIINEIGKEKYRFCLANANFIIGSWPEGWQQKLPLEMHINYFCQTGLNFWLETINQNNVDLIKRLKLRLPKKKIEKNIIIADKYKPVAEILCQKITKEVNLQCYHLLK